LCAAYLIFSPSLCAAQQSQNKNVTGCPAKTGDSLQLLDLSAPNSANAEEHYSRALRLQSEGNEAGAEDELRAAVVEKPSEDKYIRGLTLFYINRKRYDEAIGVIRDQVKLCGVTALGYELEAELLSDQKLFDPAYEAVRRSLELSDHNARMHELLGLIYVAKRQNAAAVPELQKAAALDPDQPQIRYFYGRVLYTTGRYPEARDQFLACLKLQPEYPKALENLGLCYEALQDYAKATQSYLEAIGLEKRRTGRKRGEPYAFYGAMLLKLGQSDKALPTLREGVAAAPNSFVANYELGRALLSLDQLEEAENFLLTAARLDAKFSRTYYLLGELRKKQKRPSDAERYWALFKQLDSVAENREFPLTDR
jgi:tetratricopeptide (TPR) repeat protein